MAEARNRLRFNCTACQTLCEHVGAAVSLVLEEKTALGLAAPARRATAAGNPQRAGVARSGLARPPGTGEDREVPPPLVRSAAALDRLHDHQCAFGQDLSRGVAGRRAGQFVSARVPTSAPTRWARASTFCTCCIACGGDFPPRRGRNPIATARRLSTCFTARNSTLHLQLPDRPDAELVKAVGSLADGPIDDVRRLVDCLTRLDRLGRNITVYPDAEELIQRRLFERHMSDRMAEIQKDPRGTRCASNC